MLQEGEVEPVGSPRVVKVKVRVVAATNRDLTTLIAQGKFREDLLPPERPRPEDAGARREGARTPALVTWFAEQFARTNNYRPKRFTDAVGGARVALPGPATRPSSRTTWNGS